VEGNLAIAAPSAAPDLTLNAKGEICRMVNTSGSVSYDLALTDRTNNRDLVMQVLAVDGVAVSVPTTVALRFAAVVCWIASPFAVTPATVAPSLEVIRTDCGASDSVAAAGKERRKTAAATRTIHFMGGSYFLMVGRAGQQAPHTKTRFLSGTDHSALSKT
jgi:hypothetical protein